MWMGERRGSGVAGLASLGLGLESSGWLGCGELIFSIGGAGSEGREEEGEEEDGVVVGGHR